MRIIWLGCFAGVAIGFVLNPGLAAAQPVADTLAQAQELSARGDFSDVVILLEPYVRDHPARIEAWVMLAQHQYWAGDPRAARQTFGSALALHPGDATVRTTYGRFLLETGDRARARKTVMPLAGRDAEAETILGTAAWWQGDTTTAAQHFRRALALDPGHAEAAENLASIQAETRPWMRLTGGGGTDTQPLTVLDADAELGTYLTPLQTVRLNASYGDYDAPRERLTVSRLSLSHRAFWPAVALDTEVAAGYLIIAGAGEWIGNVALGFRPASGIRADVRAERRPYLHTIASLSTPIMTTHASGVISLDRAGWLAETSLQREMYPDDNAKNIAYLWLLAPVLQDAIGDMKAGYSLAYQHAERSRFRVVTAGPGGPPFAGAQEEGRYDPYHTPHNWVAHSIIASVTLRAAPGITLDAGGAYAVVGHEDAPEIQGSTVGGLPRVTFSRQPISPWNIRAGVSAQLSPNVGFRVEGEHTATTWYDASVARLSILWRF
jgi:hypothetical protein